MEAEETKHEEGQHQHSEMKRQEVQTCPCYYVCDDASCCPQGRLLFITAAHSLEAARCIYRCVYVFMCASDYPAKAFARVCELRCSSFACVYFPKDTHF